MTDITMELRGARFAQDALLQFADDYGPRNALNTLRTALRRSMRPLMNELLARTPVVSGDLRDAVFLSVRQANNFERFSSQLFSPTTVATAEVGYRWRRDEPGVRNAALAQEFGTVNQSATPVLQSVFNSRIEQAAENFIEEVTIQIARRARTFARQQSSGTFNRR